MEIVVGAAFNWLSRFISKRWPWMDRRIAITILVLLVGAYLITAVLTYFLIDKIGAEHSADTWRAFYAAWCEDLIFFTLVGSVVAVISFRPPSQERFSQRVAILYGAPDVPVFVLRYNENQIKKLAGYATLAERHVEIEEYNSDYKAFKIRVTTDYNIRNAFRDEEYSDIAIISIEPDKFEISPPEIGRIHSIKFGAHEELLKPVIITSDGFRGSFPFKIGPGKIQTFCVEYSYWIREDEEQFMLPQRLVERFSMDIVNRLEQTVSLEREGRIVSDLTFGIPFAFQAVETVSPGETVFTYRLRAPLKSTG